jgi:UDP-N-acetylglucosamine 2-epimerase (non-hydrolysing)
MYPRASMPGYRRHRSLSLPPHHLPLTLVVAGARPNFMKVAPILAALERRGVPRVLVHTGQHYDPAMSGDFFRDLGIPAPDYHLGVGSASHAVQTARIMESFEPILLERKPRWVVVVGDVNSTLACALVASKLREQLGLKIAHVEAGLRSHDWTMPEEVNRVLADRLADLLLVPSRDAIPNLIAEGLDQARIRFAGNVMIDTLLQQLPAAQTSGVLQRYRLPAEGYAIATLHRPSNVDDARSLSVILDALVRVSEELPVVFPMHPRTRRNAEEWNLRPQLERLRVFEPLGYRNMLALTSAAAVALTDSGGIQEETTVLGVPCVTLREQTERPVTVTEGTNQLAAWPLTADGIVSAYREARARGRVAVGSCRIEGWDGGAADRIVDALLEPGPGEQVRA